MKETSVKYMGSLRAQATFHQPGRTGTFTDLPDPIYDRHPMQDGDSYINDDLELATRAPDDVWIIHQRSWAKKGSASSPCSRTRNGLIQGRFFGQKNRFETRLMMDPDRPEEYTYRIREVRWPS